MIEELQRRRWRWWWRWTTFLTWCWPTSRTKWPFWVNQAVPKDDHDHNPDYEPDVDPHDDPHDDPDDPDSPLSVPNSVYSACQLLHSGWCKIESKPSVTRLSSTCLVRTIMNMVTKIKTTIQKWETSQQQVLSGQSQSPDQQLESHLKMAHVVHPNSTVTNFGYSVLINCIHAPRTCILPSHEKNACVRFKIQNLGMGTTFGDLPIKG